MSDMGNPCMTPQTRPCAFNYLEFGVVKTKALSRCDQSLNRGMLALFRMPQVVIGLHFQPRSGAANTGAFQTQCEVRANRGTAMQYTRQMFTAIPQVPRKCRNFHIQGVQYIFAQDFPRMGWVKHSHNNTYELVIVQIVHQLNAVFRKAEYHAPVTANANRPKTGQVTFQRVQSKAGHIHISRGSCAVKQEQYAPKFYGMFSTDTASAAGFVEQAQAFVAKTNNHVAKRDISHHALQSTLDNPSHPAMLSPVAAWCGSAGLAARQPRRKQKPRLSHLAGSGFLLRNAWRVQFMDGLCGRRSRLPVLGSGLLTRIVPSALFSSGEAGLTRKPRNTAMTNPVNMPANVSIGNVLIHQQDGLYSLNDLHKASGSDQKHKPVHFLANEQTKALVVELQKVGISTFKTTKGRYGSTYACRELVIAYAAWISAAFHLQVIRVFLDSVEQVNQPLPPPVPTRTLTFTVPQDETHNVRWLLDIDRQGNERVQRLAQSTHVLTRDRLVRMLIQNPADLNLTLEERLSILGGQLRILHQSAGLAANRLQLKPANAPALDSGQVASIGG